MATDHDVSINLLYSFQFQYLRHIWNTEHCLKGIMMPISFLLNFLNLDCCFRFNSQSKFPFRCPGALETYMQNPDD